MIVIKSLNFLPRILISGWMIFLFAGLLFFRSDMRATTYYVSSNNGNDTNDGLSPEWPWASLNKIYSKSISSDCFQPGDEILLERSGTWYGQIWLDNVHGTADKPIVIDAYGDGTSPLLIGDSENFEWTAVKGHPGIYSASTGAGSNILLGYDGAQRLLAIPTTGFNLNTQLDAYLNTFTADSFGPIGSVWPTIYVKTPNGLTPSYPKIWLFRGPTVELSNCSYVTVQNLSFNRTSEIVDMNSGSHITVNQLHAQNNMLLGIYLRIQNQNVLVENNTINTSGNDFIYVLQSSNNTIQRNTLSNMSSTVLGLPTNGDQSAIGLQQSVNTIVQYNTVLYGGGGIDYYLEQGSTVAYNYLFHTKGLATPHGTNLTVHHNIWNGDPAHVTYNERNGIAAQNTGKGTILIYNNVLYGAGQFGLYSISGPVLFLNNIVYGVAASTNLTEFAVGTSADYNAYFSTGTAHYIWEGQNYTAFQSFQTSSALETHSLFVNPQFLSGNPSLAVDFQLRSSSPLIDAGINLVSIGLLDPSQPYTNFAGVPQGSGVDIGAF